MLSLPNAMALRIHDLLPASLSLLPSFLLPLLQPFSFLPIFLPPSLSRAQREHLGNVWCGRAHKTKTWSAGGDT